MLLYYITDRRQFPGGATDQRRSLLDTIAEAARAGVDYIQLREKDLPARILEQLAREVVNVVRGNSATTKLLINSRIDVAVATGADGVHLTSTDISAADARAAIASSRRPAASRQQSTGAMRGGQDVFTIAVSTHSIAEVELAYAHGADFVVFGPVFEKAGVPARSGLGVRSLRHICAKFDARRETQNQKPVFPILALGGITLENTRACLDAGAAGIAAIRLFQQNDVAQAIARLREIASAGRIV